MKWVIRASVLALLVFFGAYVSANFEAIHKAFVWAPWWLLTIVGVLMIPSLRDVWRALRRRDF